jgi:predicted metallo-beta-lactamase superfamily hydrolase
MNPIAPVIIPAGQGLSVEPVAFDSMGIKGMCSRVKTPDLTITIDPGVSAQTEQFPLPQNLLQQLLTHYEAEVIDSCARSEAIVISHYHLDHFTPKRESRIYAKKLIFAKALNDLSQKQLETAKRFFKTIDGLPKEIIWADARRFRFKKTEIAFSEPIWHGRAAAEPGKVIMTTVHRGREKVLLSSDIAGPADPQTTEQICAINPTLAVIDGYPSFLVPAPATDLELVKSIINLCRILNLPGLKTLILDHHLCRDYRYPALFKTVYEKAATLKKRLGTAAEIAGQGSAILEGLKNYGTTRWHRWQPIEPEDLRTCLSAALNRGQISPDWLIAFDRWVKNP